MELSTPSPTGKAWLAWLAVVFGGPALGFAFLLADPTNPGPTLALMGLCALLNIFASASLARKIAANRIAAARSGATTGLVAGLLLGGWAVMLALFCAGCASELKIDFR